MRGRLALMHIAIGAAIGGSFAGQSHAQDRDTNALRAALVFNIIRFIDLPPRPHGGPLLLCIDKGDQNGAALMTLNGQHIADQTISVRPVNEGAVADCNFRYLGNAAAADIAHAQQPGLLLIGEGPHFINDGGMVGLVQTGKQIRFEINVAVARRCRVNISSQLLRLASRVQQ